MAQRSLALFLAALVLAVPAALVSADFAYTSVTPAERLQNLMSPGATFQVGPLTFSNFDMQSSYDWNQPGLPPSANSISVEGVLMADGSFALHFLGAWMAVGNQTLDTSISFLAACDATTSVTGASLMLTGTGAARGGMAALTEEVAAGPPAFPGLLPVGSQSPLYVYNTRDTGGNSFVKLSDWIGLGHFKSVGYPNGNVMEFVGENSLTIRENILASGGGMGSATVSEFFEAFQVADSAPEPATLSVLSLGAMALLRRSRR